MHTLRHEPATGHPSLARAAVPVLFVSAAITSVITPLLLSFGGRNDALTVVVAVGILVGLAFL